MQNDNDEPLTAKDILDRYTSIPKSILDIESLGDSGTLRDKPTTLRKNTELQTVVVQKLPRSNTRATNVVPNPKYPLVQRNISKKVTYQKSKSSDKITTSGTSSDIKQIAGKHLQPNTMYSGPKITVIKTDNRPVKKPPIIKSNIQNKSIHPSQPSSKKSTDKTTISFDKLDSVVTLPKHSKKPPLRPIKINAPKEDTISKKSVSVSKLSKKNSSLHTTPLKKKKEGSLEQSTHSQAGGTTTNPKSESKKKIKPKKRKIKPVISTINRSQKTKNPKKILKKNKKIRRKSVSTSNPTRWKKYESITPKTPNYKTNKERFLYIHTLLPAIHTTTNIDNATKLEYLKSELHVSNSSQTPESLINNLFIMIQDPSIEFHV